MEGKLVFKCINSGTVIQLGSSFQLLVVWERVSLLKYSPVSASLIRIWDLGFLINKISQFISPIYQLHFRLIA